MTYSKIIITNLPSFYKLNLYNRINQKIRILVVFTGEDGSIRNESFYKNNFEFDYLSLHGLSSFYKIIKLYQIIKRNKFSELVIGGWDSPAYWFSAFLVSKKKNSIVVESSHLESQVSGVKGLLKKFFLSRITKVYASGYSQKKLVKALEYKGEIIITKGVGIFNIISQPKYMPVLKIVSFLYVGRFSSEKNLVNLIKVFNSLPQFNLNLIGYGPQENYLKSIANKNIFFIGSVMNEELPKYFIKNDVFILPSFIEPWGLVIEESFNNGIPVIVSNKVGCAEEIVVQNLNGLIFSVEEGQDSLKKAVMKISKVDFYNKLKLNISHMDFKLDADNQVKCYL